jgi:hypothetical protein
MNRPDEACSPPFVGEDPFDVGPRALNRADVHRPATRGWPLATIGGIDVDSRPAAIGAFSSMLHGPRGGAGYRQRASPRGRQQPSQFIAPPAQASLELFFCQIGFSSAIQRLEEVTEMNNCVIRFPIRFRDETRRKRSPPNTSGLSPPDLSNESRSGQDFLMAARLSRPHRLRAVRSPRSNLGPAANSCHTFGQSRARSDLTSVRRICAACSPASIGGSVRTTRIPRYSRTSLEGCQSR